MERFIMPAILLALSFVPSANAQTLRPFTIDDLLKVHRVNDPQLSPDGQTIAFTVTDMDKEINRGRTQIYTVPAAGGEPHQLTKDEHSSGNPRWSPNGRLLAFVSARDAGQQIWTVDVTSGELKRVTSISTGADGPVWSPDGHWIAFTSDIYPECTTDECNNKRQQAAAQSKVQAKLVDRLLFRHWKAWKEGMRSHIFVVQSTGGDARDETPGDFDAPPFSLGGPPDYTFSPDSHELAFTRNTDKVEAASTNSDIFLTPVNGGEARNITISNRAADASPLYSPDGRYIAYRAQAKPGFESDRFKLMLYDRKSGQVRSISDSLDSWVDGFTFSPDSKSIYFVAQERGLQPVYAVSLDNATIRKIIPNASNDDVQVSADGKTLIFSRSSSTNPAEIYRANADGSGIAQVTSINGPVLSGFHLKPAEDVSWTGAAGSKVSGYIIKPANFTPEKKWPMIVLIHGGPQGAWGDNWGYRWNPQVFAAAGYVVFTPNPRGSTGYGQTFVDEISGDWGGKAFTDIREGVAHVISLGYVDQNRIGAAGGSYGGYMVDWIEGHNDDPRFQFKVLVSHAGVYNLTSMYGATEEIWFPEWEFKGNPWDNPELYSRWSPHMFVKNFKTPLLVTHGEMDFRVPVGEGLQLFTALQRKGVESKLLYFPDEGHWIAKPQNSALWYNTVLGWFNQHLNP